MIGLNNTSVNDRFVFQNKTVVTIDFSLAAWNTVAQHEVFTITGGLVALSHTYFITENAAAGAGALIAFGIEGATGNYSAAQIFSNLVVNRAIAPAGTVSTADAFATYFASTASKANYLEMANRDLGFEISVNAFTDGTVIATCYWTPITAGAMIVAGDGSPL